MPPRSRQQGRNRPVQSVPLPDDKDINVTSDPAADPGQQTAPDPSQEPQNGPQSPVETFVAQSDADGVEAAVSPLAAPQRRTVPPSTYQNKPAIGHGNAVPSGRILRGDEPFTFEGERVGDVVVCTENVYREVFYTGTKRPSYVIVARRGQQFRGKGLLNLTEQQETDGVA